MDGGKGETDMTKAEACRLFVSSGYAFGFLRYHWRIESSKVVHAGASEDLPDLGLFLDIYGRVHLCFVTIQEFPNVLNHKQQEHLSMISQTKNTAFVLFTGQDENDNSLYRFYDRKLLLIRQANPIDSLWRELVSTLRQGN